jgi:hypothetical protein
MEFKVGDRVKAKAYTDCFGVRHAEVTSLVVADVTPSGGQHGVAPYDRLNCYNVDRTAQVMQVEAAARFFEHDNDNLANLQTLQDAGVFDNEREFQSTRVATDITEDPGSWGEYQHIRKMWNAVFDKTGRFPL